MRPHLPCCTPVRKPFPSGITWAHRNACPVGHGQKVGNEPTPLGERPPTPAEADRLRVTGQLALRAWLAHPDECPCYGCGYVNAHLDDLDDEHTEVTTLEDV